MRKIEGYDIEYDFSSFRKIADLIYFEGPFLSHYVSSKGDDYLFYWVDRDGSDNTTVYLSENADITGNVFGGGDQGVVEGSATVNIQNAKPTIP